MKRFLLATMLALAVSTPAMANVPITIQLCQMNYYNGGQSLGESIIYSNTNVFNRTITAVRFKFSFFNAFDELLGIFYGTDTGTFSPGVTINKVPRQSLVTGNVEPYWLTYNPWGSDIKKFVCTVDSVKYDDGSVNLSPTPQ